MLKWSPTWREQTLASLSRDDTEWDLIVVGGGITGAGVYREAASRGLKVLLLEQQDFAWGTSSRSSKMVHGGLRYLGVGQFGLANDSVKERQRLMSELPGLVNPLPFLMGHYKGSFPGPKIFNLLLTIYDWMAGKRYRQFIDQGVKDYWAPGVNEDKLLGMTRFADAVTDDARLVMRVLHDGNDKGGVALNYLKAVDTLRNDAGVSGLSVEDQITKQKITLRSKVVVNATGAWTDALRATLGQQRVIRPLRGSHLVVPFWRLPVSFSVSFFHPQDKRPVFAFPWEGVTVIGTTDIDHRVALDAEAVISAEELAYLLEAVNHQFSQANIVAGDVISTWSGVRPVVSENQNEVIDDAVDEGKPSSEKREHAIWNDKGLISVAGGKLTTYRLIALDVLQAAVPYLPNSLSLDALSSAEPFLAIEESAGMPRGLSPEARKRLIGRHGLNAEKLIAASREYGQELEDRVATTDTLWAELIWACLSESVEHLDDLLLRRTRIGLLLPAGAQSEMATVKAICQKCLAWDDAHWQHEWHRYQAIIERAYSLPRDKEPSGVTDKA